MTEKLPRSKDKGSLKCVSSRKLISPGGAYRSSSAVVNPCSRTIEPRLRVAISSAMRCALRIATINVADGKRYRRQRFRGEWFRIARQDKRRATETEMKPQTFLLSRRLSLTAAATMVVVVAMVVVVVVVVAVAASRRFPLIEID